LLPGILVVRNLPVGLEAVPIPVRSNRLSTRPNSSEKTIPILLARASNVRAVIQGAPNRRGNFVEGTKPNLKKIQEYVGRSLMLVTALSPVIGYDKASKIAHYAMDNDLTLKEAALKLGFVTEREFDRMVDPAKMVKPYVAAAGQ